MEFQLATNLVSSPHTSSASVSWLLSGLARILKGLRASWVLLRVSGLLGGAVGRFGENFGRVLRRLRASLALLRDSGLFFVLVFVFSRF